MPGTNLLTRIDRHIIKRHTFLDAAGFGEAGDSIVLWTCTGEVLIKYLSAFCSTLLTGSGTTIELGCVGNTAELIAQVDPTAIDADEFWTSGTPEISASNAVTNKLISANVLITVGAGGPITAGVIEFVALWVPISANGNLA